MVRQPPNPERLQSAARPSSFGRLPDPGRIVAVLGPTNTGKTHFAVERMLAHRTGMMGFPLRLLAREIFDRIVAIKGPHRVALITGEEKLGPDEAAYIVATVEAMPLHREVAFLGVDEIQLCADYERGHIFTDRLLNARGTEETMFLGSDTIRPVLRRLIPEVDIITRPRFSTLRWAGPMKLTRLPRRSAIVAFSAAEVYTLAELVRRQRGGAAVVLGALSPRTRNAQVAMYQSGEVDHLVATDAIGMGLNMDVAHVAFARLDKFDGLEQRRLKVTEIAQIAGRAGRHMADGTFGTTNGAAELDEREIEAVETHTFPPIKAIKWRNDRLDFRSVEALVASLDRPPPDPCLVKVRDAIDDRSLVMLAKRAEIVARAKGPERVRLLWQVCQIPDFSKTLTDAHLHLLATVFRHVTSGRGKLPNEWVGGMIARLDRTDGDIDALVSRLAHIRTWTYLSHRSAWLDDPAHWQGRAREVEDRLSDALHERLAQRFVNRRTSILLRSLRERGELFATIEDSGEVVADGELMGRLDGLRFALAEGESAAGQKVLASAARRAVVPELRRRAGAIAEAPDEELTLTPDDRIVWRGAVIARLVAGTDILKPRAVVVASEELGPRAGAAVEARVGAWVQAWLRRDLGPLFRLVEASSAKDLGASARGLAFRLAERLGTLAREEAEPLMHGLGEPDRTALTRLGVRFGRLYLYLPQLLKPRAVAARVRLLRLFQGQAPAEPPAGRTVLRGDEVPESADPALVLGFVVLGTVALRLDVAERLAAGIRARARAAPSFALPVELAAEAGLTRAELETVLVDLGFRAREEQGGTVWAPAPVPRRRTRPRAERRKPERQGAPHSPFAALAALKLAR